MATNTDTDDRFNADDGDNLRDALDAAFTQAEGGDDPPDEKPEQTEQAPDDKQEKPQDKAQPAAGRDAQGRFAAKEQAPGNLAADPAQGAAPAMPPAPAPGDLKAPASWTPQAREKWAGADPLIREEVIRREGEHNRLMQESASARQFIGAFESVVRPYEMFIRQENSNPLQAVANLMATAGELRMGTPHGKANLVAGMIQNFGIDVVMLDKILSGMGFNADNPPPAAPLRDPRVDQLLWQQQQFAQQQQDALNHSVAQELSTFGSTHEFFNDVRGIMADLVDYRSRNGQPVDLEKIYAQACQMDDGVSKILTQRNAAAQASTQRAAALRARRAAVSVKGETTPDGATVPKNDSIRAALEAAIESHGE